MKKHIKLLLLLLTAPTVVCAQKFAPASYVNPFIGTGGHGHTFPGALAPFGMVQLSPDTRLTGWDGCSGYHYSDSVIYGFSHTHLSGTGVADYCDILLMPTSGKPVFKNTEYASAFKKASEAASPGYYSVYLDKPQAKVELTATPRVGIHRYTFTNADKHNILLDLQHRDDIIDSYLEIVGNNEVRGFRRSKAWATNQVVYFVIRFSKPFTNIYTEDSEGKPIKAIPASTLKCSFRFAGIPNEIVTAKVGISAVSIYGALNNLNEEMPKWDFDATYQQTLNKWNKELGKIEVEGGTHDQKAIFYTALYHCMSVPNLFMDADGQYLGTDLKPHKADGFTPYTIFSLWDTFRAYHPLMTIIDTKRTNDFIRTFLSHYTNNGLLPVWELAGNETFCMIGYHSIPVIADAYLKGIRDYDVRLALRAMKSSASLNHFGLDAYRQYGCIPGDKESESVSKTLEYAYDDWCIAQMALDAGDTNTYHTYIDRSQFYRNLFDPETGFMRPRINGGFKTPFDPTEVDFNFTEGNSWQYSFFAPHDIGGLIDLHGGKERFAKKIDELFTTEQSLSGRHQVDITGLIGQYAHGNEPSHHMAYLYSFVGQPWKTQQVARKIMDQMYLNTPDGLIGNEDCGQMSAWYVMSALGFYPVTPGANQYIFGTPIFRKATIHLENGKKFTVERNAPADTSYYIQSATLNGKAYEKAYLNHADIMAGGTLTFTLNNTPNKQWASTEANQAAAGNGQSSRTINPYFKGGTATFRDSLVISMHCADSNASIRYTLDGSNPAVYGITYKHPIWLRNTATIKAIAIAPNRDTSFTIDGTFTKVTTSYGIAIASKCSRQYTAGGPEGIIDGLRGAKDFRLGGWQGYQDQDFEAVVDLGNIRQLTRIGAGFLQDSRSWILMPKSVEFFSSTDGVTFKSIATVANSVPDTYTDVITQDLTLNLSIKARYIKVVARKYGNLPSWHLGAGYPAFIFIDEIIIE